MSGHHTEDCYGLKHEIEMLIKSRDIQCTQPPTNVNHDPFPNHRNQRPSMITLEEYGDLKGSIFTIGNAEAVRTTPRAALLITVQLKPPVMVVTYQPWPFVAISGDWSQVYKAVPWAYQSKGKEKIIKTATAHRMTRYERCYAHEELN